jgi:hypothetical protein
MYRPLLFQASTRKAGGSAVRIRFAEPFFICMVFDSNWTRWLLCGNGHIRNRIKRLAENRQQLTAFPRAVRYYESEEPSFFVGGLRVKQSGGRGLLQNDLPRLVCPQGQFSLADGRDRS